MSNTTKSRTAVLVHNHCWTYNRGDNYLCFNPCLSTCSNTTKSRTVVLVHNHCWTYKRGDNYLCFNPCLNTCSNTTQSRTVVLVHNHCWTYNRGNNYLRFNPCLSTCSSTTKNCCNGTWSSSNMRPCDIDESINSLMINLDIFSRLALSIVFGSLPVKYIYSIYKYVMLVTWSSTVLPANKPWLQ